MAFVDMTAKTLNALKGWPAPAAVDFHAEFDAAALAILNPIPPGAVLHLSSVGTYLLGVGTLQVMPLFNFASSDDPDVNNDGGNAATEKGVWVPISPTGQAMALPAKGSYELVSTYFDITGSYPPNTPLTSPLSGANAGKLVAGLMHTDMIVGITSRGVVDNGYGTDGLAFWPEAVYP